MKQFTDLLFAALRSSEFWTLLGQAYVEAMSVPVPDEFKAMGWAYIALRIVGKVAKFIFPAGTGGAWFKPD